MGRKRGEETPSPPEAPKLNTPFAALAALAHGLPPGPGEHGGVDRDGDGDSSRDRVGMPGRWPAKIVVRHERKGRGGKTVTRVSGLPEANRAALAKALKRGLGCGASVEGDDVILLGSVADRAAEWLRAKGAPRVVVGN